MKITNTQTGPRGINTINGPVLIEPGQTVEADVPARERKHIEAAGWFRVEGSYADDGSGPPAPPAEDVSKLKARIAELEQENAALKAKDGADAPSNIVAKHRGGGSYSIFDGDAEVREKLTKAQAEAFNALDDAGKGAWLKDNPAQAAQ